MPPVFRPETGKRFDPPQLDREFRKVSSAMDLAASEEEVYTWLPVKGVMAILDGDITGQNPTITDEYNVASVTWLGTGNYRVNLDQTTILGDNIVTRIYPALTVIFAGTTLDYGAEVTGGSGPGGYIDIQVFIRTLQGQNINKTPVDLNIGDTLWLQGYLNVEVAGVPLPAADVRDL